MLTKTQGIVFNFIKYKETSIIVKIFTRKLGVQSYIVNGVRTRGKTNKISYFQPLNLVDLVVYNNTKTELHRISEIQFFIKYKTIPIDVKKSAINLFLAETLNKMLMEQEENPALFDFIVAALTQFDDLTSEYTEFHIFILLNVLDYLGHSIPFDLTSENEKMLSDIKTKTTLPNLNRKKRTELLNFVLQFYKEHSQLQLNLKSLPVLESIFN